MLVNNIEANDDKKKKKKGGGSQPTKPNPQPTKPIAPTKKRGTKGLIGTSARAFNNISPSPIIRNPEEKRNMLSALSNKSKEEEDKPPKTDPKPATPPPNVVPFRRPPQPPQRPAAKLETLSNEDTTIVAGRGKDRGRGSGGGKNIKRDSHGYNTHKGGNSQKNNPNQSNKNNKGK